MDDNLLFECKAPDFSLLELLSPPCLDPPDPEVDQLPLGGSAESAVNLCLHSSRLRMGVRGSPPLEVSALGGAAGVIDRFPSDASPLSLAPDRIHLRDCYEVPESTILSLMQEAAKLEPPFTSHDTCSMNNNPNPQEECHTLGSTSFLPAPDPQEEDNPPRMVTFPPVSSPGLWAEECRGGTGEVGNGYVLGSCQASDVQSSRADRVGGKGQEGDGHWPMSSTDSHTHPSAPVRTRTPRKQPHPQRSAQSGDPTFQGVTVCMERELVGHLDCRLHITAHYSPGLQQKLTRFRSHSLGHRETPSTPRLSSSEEDPYPGHQRMRRCASCGTQKTPLWRDAEDGTPLCNACGIRYKKYRIRCPKCWHIPKKEGKYFVRCLRCGDPLRLLLNARKGTNC
ncbi:GATA-type zinc finger protein 1 [Mobula hypostoma]|uniref:GATA-type zinc finger protein 1 n=1 Tax=Mobula hypostoma TaxID=723540 RepID=UPI002FC37B4F